MAAGQQPQHREYGSEDCGSKPRPMSREETTSEVQVPPEFINSDVKTQEAMNNSEQRKHAPEHELPDKLESKEPVKSESHADSRQDSDSGNTPSKIPPWLRKRNKRKAAAAVVDQCQTAPASQPQQLKGTEKPDNKKDRKETSSESLIETEDFPNVPTPNIAKEIQEDDKQDLDSKQKQSFSTMVSEVESAAGLDNMTEDTEIDSDVPAKEKDSDIPKSSTCVMPSEDSSVQTTFETDHKVVLDSEMERAKPETKVLEDQTSETTAESSQAGITSGLTPTGGAEDSKIMGLQTDIADKSTLESKESSIPVDKEIQRETEPLSANTLSENAEDQTAVHAAKEQEDSKNASAEKPIECIEPETPVTTNMDSDSHSGENVETQFAIRNEKAEIPQPKITYKSDPVRYIHTEQSTNQEKDDGAVQSSDVDSQQPMQQQDMQQPLSDDQRQKEQHQEGQVQTELQQQMEQVYRAPQNYEECRMQMILAATLAQLPPDMTIGDLYQYINPDILDSMTLPPAPTGAIHENPAQEDQHPDAEADDEYHPAKYEEVIARRAEAKMRREREREISALIEEPRDEHGKRSKARRGIRGRGRGRGRWREYDPDIGGYVPVQRMDTTYTARDDEFIGPQLPDHLQHLAQTHEESYIHNEEHQSFDFMAPEHDDVIDDEDTEEYARYEEGEVVDGDHWAHPGKKGKPRGKRRSSGRHDEHSPKKRFAREGGGSDPLGFDEGDVISNDISDFHRRLLRMSGSVQDEGHKPAYSTGLQYSETGDLRPPYVRNQPNRYQEDVMPHDHAVPPQQNRYPATGQPQAEIKKENLPEAVMQFARPKYHEEGYSERFHAAPTGNDNEIPANLSS